MHDRQHTETTLGIGQYVRVVLRHWVIIGLAAVGGLLVAAGYLLVAPTKATATTEVYPYVISTDPFNPQRKETQILDPTREEQVAGSLVVARGAAKTLPGRNASEVRRSTAVAVPSDGAVVEVSYTGSTKADAIKGANAVAAAYISYRHSSADTQIRVMSERLSPRIKSLGAQLTKATKTISSTKSTSTEHSRAVGDRDRIQTELGGLYKKRNDLLGVDTRGGEVLVPAQDGLITQTPSPSRALPTGLLSGAVLGLIGTFVRHRFDRRLRSTIDVEDAMGCRASATVPTTNLSIPTTGRVADSLRVARERLTDTVGSEGAVLLVVDTTGDTGARAAVGLALAVAETGRPTRLVLTTDPGTELRTVIEGTDHALGETYPSLEVVAPDGPRRQLDARMRAGLQQVPAGTLVIAAASSRDSEVTLLELLRYADAAAPVVRVRSGRRSGHRDMIEEIRQQAESMNTPMAGAIVLTPRHRRPARRTPKGRTPKGGPDGTKAEPDPAPRDLLTTVGGRSTPAAE